MGVSLKGKKNYLRLWGRSSTAGGWFSDTRELLGQAYGSGDVLGECFGAKVRI